MLMLCGRLEPISRQFDVLVMEDKPRGTIELYCATVAAHTTHT